jgi:threonine/homoserine/homoserine lactone efflux protein
VITGFLFGVTAAAAIGPIALLILNTGIRFGVSAGVRSAMGAAVGDLLYAVGATLAGAALIQLISEHAHTLRLVAALVLIVVGAYLLYGAFRASTAAEKTPQSERPFLTTLALTIVNPLTLIVFSGFVMQLNADTLTESAVVVVSIFVGSAVVQLVLGLGGAGLSKVLANPNAIRLLNIASGAGIALFGVVGLLSL